MGTGAQKCPRHVSKLYSFLCLRSKEKMGDGRRGFPSASSHEALMEQRGDLYSCVSVMRKPAEHISAGCLVPPGYGLCERIIVPGSRFSNLVGRGGEAWTEGAESLVARATRGRNTS